MLIGHFFFKIDAIINTLKKQSSTSFKMKSPPTNMPSRKMICI